MPILVPITMFGWIPVMLLMFAALPPRRAVISGMIVAWLFLPEAAYKFTSGIPPYTKMSATCALALISSALFDSAKLLSFRLRLIDLPILLWCVCPVFSSLSAGLGLYDGLSACFGQVVTWGLPYVLGRLYINDIEGMRELVYAVFLGGLVYTPLCLFEIKMSPVLHLWVYGYSQQWMASANRNGSWRPGVFMQHGLMVAIWMVSASIAGLCVWRTRLVRNIYGVPIIWCVLAVTATAILCMSAGALSLFALGIFAVLLTGFLKRTFVLYLLVSLAPLYMTSRITGVWDGQVMTHLASQGLNDERAGSLEARLSQENYWIPIAMQNPIFGTGIRGYGADQFWLLTLRHHGLFGLISWTLAMLIPVAVLIYRYSQGLLSNRMLPAMALALMVVLYVMDCLFNGMVNPIDMLFVGGLTGLAKATLEFDHSTRINLNDSALSFAGSKALAASLS